MISMVMVLMSGQIKGFIKDNGKKIKCMEKVKLYGKMVENILV
jgi:hypothetical protein